MLYLWDNEKEEWEERMEAEYDEEEGREKKAWEESDGELNSDGEWCGRYCSDCNENKLCYKRGDVPIE